MKQLTKNLTLSAMFLAIGFVLPFLTGQIPRIGSMLLPMHIPVFLCGLICGWQYGAQWDLSFHCMRSAIFGMRPSFPDCNCNGLLNLLHTD
jgi:riboflavin transporter FmnP